MYVPTNKNLTAEIAPRVSSAFVEQAIKLLTIVLSIYEFAVGEFPGCALIT